MATQEQSNQRGSHETELVYNSFARALKSFGTFGPDAHYANIEIPDIDYLEITDYHTGSCGVTSGNGMDFTTALENGRSIISFKSKSLEANFCIFRPLDIKAPQSVMGHLMLSRLAEDSRIQDRAMISLENGFHRQPINTIPGFANILASLDKM